MSRFQNCWLAQLLIVLVVAGCQKGPPALVRDPVIKVTGTLLIDGKPESSVLVQLMPVGDPDSSRKTSKDIIPSAMTTADGKFNFGTYDQGQAADGAPKGIYVLTAQWGAINLLGGLYSGDKFNGKYSDPDYSEIKVTVADKPVDLGTIDLDTKPAPARPKKAPPGQRPTTGVD